MACPSVALALRGAGTRDACLETMRQTDMSVRYKENPTGGLAVNLPEC